MKRHAHISPLPFHWTYSYFSWVSSIDLSVKNILYPLCFLVNSFFKSVQIMQIYIIVTRNRAYLHRVVSSNFGVWDCSGAESGVLMILYVAEYHQIWGFWDCPGVELGFLMIPYVAEYHRFGWFRATQAWNPRFWWYYVSHSIISFEGFSATQAWN